LNLQRETFRIAGSLNLQARRPFCHPANSVKPLKGYATDNIGLTTGFFNSCYMSVCLSVCWAGWHAGIYCV